MKPCWSDVRAKRRAAPKLARLVVCERGMPCEHRRPFGVPAKAGFGRGAL